MHLGLTICTCGLWLPVWLALTLLDHRSVRKIPGFVAAHLALTGAAILAGIFWIIADWKSFVLVASLITVGTGLSMTAILAVRSARRRRQEETELAARADDQHEALLHGDDQWGMFGIKPSAEPLLELPPTSRKSRRQFLAPGIAVVAGVLAFAATAMVNARSADRAPRPVSVPTATVPPPASKPIPRPMNPTPPQRIPSPILPEPPPAPTPPPTRSPVPTVRMGQQAVDGNLTFVVTSADRSKSVANLNIPFMQTTAKGTFLTVHLTITNDGEKPVVFMAFYQKLKLNGHVYGVDPAAALWTLTMDTIVVPGATVTEALSFDVPADAPVGGVLELHESSNSRGAKVELVPSK